jgi:hypothetical protein
MTCWKHAVLVDDRPGDVGRLQHEVLGPVRGLVARATPAAGAAADRGPASPSTTAAAARRQRQGEGARRPEDSAGAREAAAG